ncbi:hypothetical protein K3495_g6755 [Podosphaera aphanis]|nr:hypothetical protein K3495_g6755 [Podosphaera aphanis]
MEGWSQGTESSLSYRKCDEIPILHSIPGPVGGFECEGKMLSTQDAMKAAKIERKMYKKEEIMAHDV